MPELSEEELKKLMYARKKACPYKKEKELLVGLFPEKLIKILISQKQLVSAIREFPRLATMMPGWLSSALRFSG